MPKKRVLQNENEHLDVNLGWVCKRSLPYLLYILENDYLELSELVKRLRAHFNLSKTNRDPYHYIEDLIEGRYLQKNKNGIIYVNPTGRKLMQESFLSSIPKEVRPLIRIILFPEQELSTIFDTYAIGILKLYTEKLFSQFKEEFVKLEFLRTFKTKFLSEVQNIIWTHFNLEQKRTEFYYNNSLLLFPERKSEEKKEKIEVNLPKNTKIEFTESALKKVLLFTNYIQNALELKINTYDIEIEDKQRLLKLLAKSFQVTYMETRTVSYVF